MSAILDKFEIDISLVSASKIKYDECRIDPKFFSANQNFINDLDTLPLESFCTEIFNPPVFKREFLEDENECRYLASAEIVSFNPELNYITNEQADKLRLRVNRNWILVTGFGTIGSIRITDNIINGYAVANNVSRIIANRGYEGFIAAYLESSYGNKLLNDHAAGAVIKYIEAPHISKIPVPVLHETTVNNINEKYLNAVSCREKAFKLLEKADTLVHQYNNLPILSETNFDTIDKLLETEIWYTNLSKFTNDHRLDANFYNYLAKAAEEKIKLFSKNFHRINDVTKEIRMSPLFVRKFVENEFGVKYIAGKSISKIRKSFKYISITETKEIEEHTLRKGWTLMTCAGSIGKIGYVNDELDGATAQDIMRIVPDENKIDGGYLNCWLSSYYGKILSERQKYGAVIDRISPEQCGEILIPVASNKQQKEIGDLVRNAYELRAEAIRLEDEAQEILTQALTKNK